MENMKWFKRNGDMFFVMCTALYYLTRQENGSSLQNTADILTVVALVVIVANRILGRFVK